MDYIDRSTLTNLLIFFLFFSIIEMVLLFSTEPFSGSEEIIWVKAIRSISRSDFKESFWFNVEFQIILMTALLLGMVFYAHLKRVK